MSRNIISRNLGKVKIDEIFPHNNVDNSKGPDGLNIRGNMYIDNTIGIGTEYTRNSSLRILGNMQLNGTNTNQLLNIKNNLNTTILNIKNNKIGINTDNPTDDFHIIGNINIENGQLKVNGSTTMQGDITIINNLSLGSNLIPIQPNTIDIGQPGKEIRDIYVSGNSLWVGDLHKFDVDNGKMKFKKRKNAVVPPVILAAGGNENQAKISAFGIAAGNLEDIKLNHWETYYRTLTNDNTKTVNDVFRPTHSEDWSEETSVDFWLSNNNHIYFGGNNNQNVGIGLNNPTQKLDVLGNIKATAFYGDASNLTNIPVATTSIVGGVKIGTNLNIDGSGVLHSSDTTYIIGDSGLTENNFTNTLKSKLNNISDNANNYSLPTATSNVLGGIKIGTNLNIDGSGVLHATDTNTTYSVVDGELSENNFTNTLKSKLDNISDNANNYSLSTASSSVLGGVKVGNNLSIDGNGTLSSTDTNTTYNVVDGELSENNFTNTLKSKLDNISDNANNYSLSTASSSVLGGVKVGNNLSIDGNGTLSSTDTNTTYNVEDGGLTEKNFTNTLKSKLDGIATSANNYSLPTASSTIFGGIKVGSNLNIDGSGVLSGLSHWTENNSELYYQGNVGIGKVNPTTKLHIGGVTTIDGSILPSSNETYDLGSAAYKFRHLFLSDNSLWVGDNHKISIQNGQMKFRKRLSSSVPTSISGLGGDELGLKTFLGLDPSSDLNTVKLNQWNDYIIHLTGDINKTVDDVFRMDDLNDWEEESNIDTWLQKNNNINYQGSGNVGIGVINPLHRLDIQGNINVRDSGIFTNDVISNKFKATDIEITNSLLTNSINEKTSGTGVTIDSVLLKDNNVTAHTISAQNYSVGGTNFISASRQGNFRDLEVKDNANNSTILLSGGTHGVSGGDISITGILSTDTISEKTSATGVTIDSVLLKDNNVTAHTISAQNYSVGGTNFISASRQGNFRDLEVKDNANNSTILLSGGTNGVSGGDISITGILSTDTISEKTSGTGVTVENVLLKDGCITSNEIVNNGDIIIGGNATFKTDVIINNKLTIDDNLLQVNNNLNIKAPSTSKTFFDIKDDESSTVFKINTNTGNTYIKGKLTLNGSLIANSLTGTSGQLLSSTGTGVEWIDIPQASSTELGSVKINGNNLSIDSSTGILSATNTTYSDATTSTSGLMSATDKTKLNGITNIGSGSIITTSERTKLSGIDTNANNYSLPVATTSTLGGIKIGSGLNIINGVLSSNGGGGTSVWSESNLTASYSGNINITGNGIISNNLIVNNGFTINGQTTLSGHIIPSSNADYDLGNAEYKIRHLFLSDNSLWVGDNHKITIHGGKMKFRKRITSTLPSSITNIGGNESGIKTFLGLDPSINLNTIKLNQLNNYMKHLSGDNNKTIDDVFRTTDSTDWDEETNVDNWLEKSDNIYYGLSGNVGIGLDTPIQKLHVNGSIKANQSIICSTFEANSSNIITTKASIIPDIDNTYSLGSSTKTFKDVYVGPGSLYINGKQVIHDNSGTITVTTDDNQNLSLQTTGSGNLQLTTTGTGDIELTSGGIIQIKKTLQITDGMKITSSTANKIVFGDAINVEGEIQATSLSLDGSTSINTTKLNYLDLTTPGTAEASKVLVVDSSRNLTNIHNLTITGDINISSLTTNNSSGSNGQILSTTGSGLSWIDNTTYTVGDGGLTQKNFTTDLNTKLTNLPVITTIGSNLSLNNGNLTATNTTTGGSTGLSFYTTGDLIYSSNGNTLSKLGIGSTDQVLKVSSGVPTWSDPSSSSNWTVSGSHIYPSGSVASMIINTGLDYTTNSVDTLQVKGDAIFRASNGKNYCIKIPISKNGAANYEGIAWYNNIGSAEAGSWQGRLAFIESHHTTGALEMRSNDTLILAGSSGAAYITVNSGGFDGNKAYTGGSSDDRLKSQETLIENATATLMKLRPQIYMKKNYLGTELDKDGNFRFTITPTEKLETGLIAQEIYYEVPELRHLVLTRVENEGDIQELPQDTDLSDIQNDPDYESLGWNANEPANVYYQQLIPYLIKSNQEQQTEINTLKTENTELKSIIDKLKTATSFEDFKSQL